MAEATDLELRAENHALRSRLAKLEAQLATAAGARPAPTAPPIAPGLSAALAHDGDAQRLASLLELQTTYIIRVDLQGNYTYANRAFCERFGIDRASVLGLSSLAMVIPEDLEKLWSAAQACLTPPHDVTKVTLRKVLPTGELRWGQWEFLAVCDEQGTPHEIQCVGHDITDLMLAEEALRRSKEEIDELYLLAREEVAARRRVEEALRLQAEELQLALEAARMGAWRWDLVAQQATCSDTLARLYAVDTTDPSATYQTLQTMIHPADLPRLVEIVLGAMAGPHEFELEFRLFDGHGRERWTAAKGRVFFDAEGMPLYLAGIARDIDLRKQAEMRMQRSEARLGAIVDAGLDMIAIVQPDGTIDYINAMVTRVLGYRAEELTQLELFDLVHQEQRPASAEAIAGLMAHPGDALRLELQVKHKDGQWRWLEFKISNYLEEAAIGAVVCVGHDITERKQAEAALRELNETLEQRVHERTEALEREIAERALVEESLRTSEARWRSLVENAPAVIAMLDREGTLLFINRTPEGFDAASLVGGCVYDWLDSKTAEEMCRALATVFETGTPIHYESELIVPDGRHIWLENHLSAVWKDGKAASAIYLSSDITLRKRTEFALQQQQDFARQIMETMGQGLVVYDAAGIIEYANLCVADMFGYPQELLIGRPMISFIDPNDSPMVIANLARRAANQSDAYEVRMRTVDGNSKYVLVAATPRHREGKPDGGIAVVTDLTERRKAEEALRLHSEALTLANAELAKASRLKDEFLANMSHELRTPLTGVLGLTEGLQNMVYGPLTERQLRALRLVDESGRHLLSLINDILDLSKVEAGKMELVVADVRAADACEASLSLVRELAQKRRQTLQYVLTDATLRVHADPRRLKQILVNLLSNAVKFTPEEGEIGITVERTPGDEMVSFVVWDKGIGIAPDQQANLFQPFVQLDGSLTRQYPGTGLGLALVRRLTELQGGTVHLESTAGQGSRFTIRLPAASVSAP